MELREVVKRIVDTHPDEVGRYKGREYGVIGTLMGQVMKHTRGKANPSLVQDYLIELMTLSTHPVIKNSFDTLEHKDYDGTNPF